MVKKLQGIEDRGQGIGKAIVVYLSLGSNVGVRTRNIDRAVRSVARIPKTKILKMSSLYETSAVGPQQRKFINCVIKIKTGLSPDALLDELKNIEKEMGRQKNLRWGPRVIDLDILFYGDKVVRTRTLDIPHPEIQNRRFVLEPMNEIASGFIHPDLKRTISRLRKVSLSFTGQRIVRYK